MLRAATRLEDLAEQLEQFGQDPERPQVAKAIEGIVDRLDKVHDEIKPRRTGKLILFPKWPGEGRCHLPASEARIAPEGREWAL